MEGKTRIRRERAVTSFALVGIIWSLITVLWTGPIYDNGSVVEIINLVIAVVCLLVVFSFMRLHDTITEKSRRPARR